MQRKLLVWSMMLILLARCGSTEPTSAPIIIPTPLATPLRPTAAPTDVPAPTAIPPTPTVVPPMLLADRDPLHPKLRLGPAAPTSAWIVARTAPDASEATFGLWPAKASAKPQIADRLGQPLGWSADGALLLTTHPATPTSLLAIEPTLGVTTTVLTITQGTIVGALWPRNAPILYAYENAGDLLLASYRGGANRTILTRLPERTLVPASLAAAPDSGTLALLATGGATPTLELYRIDPQTGQSLLLDQSSVVSGTPGLLWSPQGQLFYEIGGGLRVYDPLLNIISPLSLNARPLAWTSQGLLARLNDSGGLVRWSNGMIQPFANNNSQVLVDDVQTLFGVDGVLNIQGQLWYVRLP